LISVLDQIKNFFINFCFSIIKKKFKTVKILIFIEFFETFYQFFYFSREKKNTFEAVKEREKLESKLLLESRLKTKA
jgi:hypothetical protein